MVNLKQDSGIARATDSVLVVVDVQEKLFPLMQDREALAERIAMLMRGANALSVPILVTEQYRQGLGETIPLLKSAAPAEYLEKTTFSCFGDVGFLAALGALGRSRLVLCGIEAHICVTQTALQAGEAGYAVHVAEDAVSSRLDHAKDLGIARMRAAGTATSVG